MKKSLLIGSCIALAIAGVVIQSCVKPETPANLCFSFSPGSPAIGQPVQFTANCSVGMSGYTWNFGDGHTGSGAIVSHTYSKSGYYQVTLTANGQNGPNYQSNSLQVSYPAWNSYSTNEIGYLYSSYFLNKDSGYICGVSGIVEKTTNGGNSWTSVGVHTAADLYSIFFTSPTTGYTVGGPDTVYETTNGGSSWTAVYIGALGYGRWICFTDANTGYIAGYYTIYKTTNAGSTWTQLTMPPGNTAQFVYFFNANTGYIAGDGDTVLYTTNAGATWTKKTVGTGWGISEVYFPSVDTGYATGGGGMVFKTVNAGATWTNIATTSTYESQTGIGFINDTVGFTTGADGGMYETFDGGVTWGDSPSGASNGVYGLFIYNRKYAFAVAAGELYTMTVTP